MGSNAGLGTGENERLTMTKKHFIALADAIRKYEMGCAYHEWFTESQVKALADFCQSQNPRFNRERWLDYIAGKCGPNGGAKC
jgi:hypothetical protein